jgi:hypothetical protein
VIHLNVFRFGAKISKPTPPELIALALILAAVIWIFKR